MPTTEGTIPAFSNSPPFWPLVGCVPLEIKVAEGVGFEPTDAINIGSFQDCSHKPLDHPSGTVPNLAGWQRCAVPVKMQGRAVAENQEILAIGGTLSRR